MSNTTVEEKVKKLEEETRLYTEYLKVIDKIANEVPEDKRDFYTTARIFSQVCSDKDQHDNSTDFTTLKGDVISNELVKKIRSIGAIYESKGLANFQPTIKTLPSKPMLWDYPIDKDSNLIGQRFSVSMRNYDDKIIEREGAVIAITQKTLRFAGEEEFSKGVYISFDDGLSGPIGLKTSENNLKPITKKSSHKSNSFNPKM